MRAHELHEKLKLVQSLKALAKQHELVLAAYERKVEERLADAARQGSASVGGKRAGPPLIAEGPEAKRQRQLLERDRRKKDLWDEIIRIVEKVRKNPKSEAFRQPVDIVKLKIPDYFTIIHHPMDISTVLKKLRSNPRQYIQPVEAADDMRLIWRNCRTYNGEKHVVTQCANVLSETFEKLWGQANIESRWQVEIKREEREEQAFAESGGGEGVEDEDLVTQLRYKRTMLGDLIAAKDVQENVPPGSLGELQPDRDMTFEEKRKLSAHMASIPGEKLTAVLDIIAECENIPSDDEGEYELDVDSLNNSTLWKLKAYVDGVLTATTGPPPKKTSANRASAGGAPTKTPGAAAAAPAAVPPPAAAAPAALLPAGVGAAAGQGQPAAAAPAAAPGAAATGNGPVGQQQQLAAQPPLQPPQQQQQALPPPQKQQQQEPHQQTQQTQQQGLRPPPPQKPQQQQPDSPGDSGGASADEMVASTAPGGAARQVTHHTMGGDAFTVAQSGTNVRSNFVKSKPRQPVAGAADASKPGQPAAMDIDTVNDDWTALAKDATGQQDEAAAAAAGAAADKPTAAAGAGAAAAAVGPKAEGGEAAAAAGGGADMWDEFAEKAKQEEEKLHKQKEEEERRKREEEEQKLQLEEQERQKELERQQEAEEKKAAAANELLVKGPPAGAAQENQVQNEMDKLLGSAAAMEVEVEDEEDEEAEEEEDEQAGQDQDMAEEPEEGEAAAATSAGANDAGGLG